MADRLSPAECSTCRKPLGATGYVLNGYLGTYTVCEWCMAGEPRPEGPEIITDSFAAPPKDDLDAILDRLFLMGEPA